jgi:hypothetical protein
LEVKKIGSTCIVSTSSHLPIDLAIFEAISIANKFGGTINVLRKIYSASLKTKSIASSDNPAPTIFLPGRAILTGYIALLYSVYGKDAGGNP